MDIHVLGRIEVHGPGGPATLVGARQRTLVGLLALQVGRLVPKARLVDALWGEEPPRTALPSLHSHVSRVRQALRDVGLPDALDTGGAGYVLALPREVVDAHRFEDAMQRAKTLADPGRVVAELERGLDQWRGDAFADGRPVGWGEAEVVRLEELRVAAAEQMWSARIDRGDHDSATAALEVLCAANPTREPLTELLMLALCRAGRPADALQRYERLRRRLVEDLGVDPGQSLRRLHTAILRGEREPAPAQSARSPMPAPVGHFVGREPELSILDTWLAQDRPDTPIAVICGPAGVGKTSLAVQWSRRRRERFVDGQVFVEARGHEPARALTASEILGEALVALGVPADRLPAQIADRLALYRDVLSQRRVLVVVDNAGTADQVLPLVPSTSDSRLLVTSRYRLASVGVQHVVSLLELDTFDAAVSGALLHRVVGAERVAAEPDAVAELVRLCGGLPLALRVAAARLVARPRLTVARLVAEVSAGLDALAHDGDGVRAVLLGAYHALSEPAARLFRLLGIHPGTTFTADLAAALAAGSPGRARRHIDELAAAHLVIEQEIDRYRFHDLIRRFAQERGLLEDNGGARAAATSRLHDWYLGLADRANAVLDPSRNRVVASPAHDPGPPPFAAQPEAVLSYLDGERANIVAVAGHAAATGNDQMAWQFAYLVAGYFESRGHAEDRIAVYHSALDAAQRCGNPAIEGLMCSGLGIAYFSARRYEQALEQLGRALDRMREAGDPRGEGHIHSNIAAALCELGRYDEAIEAGTRALTVHTANAHRHGMVLALNNLGYVHLRTGADACAIEYLDRALALARQDGDLRLEAAVLHSLGETRSERGELDQALAYYEQACVLRERIGDRHHEAVSLIEIGVTQVALGTGRPAVDRLREAFERSVAVSDQHLQALALAGLARAYLATGDLDQARVALDSASRLRLVVPDQGARDDIRRTLGQLTALNASNELRSAGPRPGQ